jgi:hypothetical protein
MYSDELILETAKLNFVDQFRSLEEMIQRKYFDEVTSIVQGFSTLLVSKVDCLVIFCFLALKFNTTCDEVDRLLDEDRKIKLKNELKELNSGCSSWFCN